LLVEARELLCLRERKKDIERWERVVEEGGLGGRKEWFIQSKRDLLLLQGLSKSNPSE
jgi:hypothetical protein